MKTLQCKGIADLPILSFLARYGGIGCTIFRHEDGSPLNVRSVINVMPAGIPQKLALAKMKQLIRRGLAAGCTCGCRGDFELTAKGKELVPDVESEVPVPTFQIKNLGEGNYKQIVAVYARSN